MNTVLKFRTETQSSRSVADILTPEIISLVVVDAVEGFGLESFAMAFTAFGEQGTAAQKLAA